jgi:hypothetical protein
VEGALWPMLFPDLDTNRSEYFTGSASLQAPTLPTISVEACLDCVPDGQSRTRIHAASVETAHIAGWVLMEDVPLLTSYAEAVSHGRQTDSAALERYYVEIERTGLTELRDEF